jgi:hypothetical protein
VGFIVDPNFWGTPKPLFSSVLLSWGKRELGLRNFLRAGHIASEKHDATNAYYNQLLLESVKHGSY